MIPRRHFFPLVCRDDQGSHRQESSIYRFSPLALALHPIDKIQMFRTLAYLMIVHFCLLPSRTQRFPLDRGTWLKISQRNIENRYILTIFCFLTMLNVFSVYDSSCEG